MPEGVTEQTYRLLQDLARGRVLPLIDTRQLTRKQAFKELQKEVRYFLNHQLHPRSATTEMLEQLTSLARWAPSEAAMRLMSRLYCDQRRGAKWPNRYTPGELAALKRLFSTHAARWIAQRCPKDLVAAEAVELAVSFGVGHVTFSQAAVERLCDRFKLIEWDVSGLPKQFGTVRKRMPTVPGSKAKAADSYVKQVKEDMLMVAYGGRPSNLYRARDLEAEVRGLANAYTLLALRVGQLEYKLSSKVTDELAKTSKSNQRKPSPTFSRHEEHALLEFGGQRRPS